MHPRHARTLAAAGLAILLASGSAGLAQSPPAAMARDAAVDRERPADPAAMRARHAERLRAVLQLRPEQEGALRTFLDAMAPPAGARELWRGEREAMAGLTTPQRLERQRARMADRQRRFDQRAAATLRFYGQLSPAQQKAFDAMGPGHRGGMGWGRHRGMGDHGHMDHKPG